MADVKSDSGMKPDAKPDSIGTMPDGKGKINLLDVVPVRCGHIATTWEGEYAVLSFPRFKYGWMRRFLLPKGMSADVHVTLEEHGTAVWRLIDGRRTVQEIIALLAGHFQGEDYYSSRIAAYIMQLHKDGLIKYELVISD